VHGLARSLGRDVKRLHEDVTSLIDCGIIERTEQGKVGVLYDVIHAGFVLQHMPRFFRQARRNL
jgi:predicted transcriptional regulator